MAQVIDGKAIAAGIRENLKKEVEAFKKQRGFAPGLATVLVGENPASKVYVKNKNRACEEAGMLSFHHALPEATSEDNLLRLVNQLNTDKQVHGILVQLPLPKQVRSDKILNAVSPAKDVDGFHPVNVGNLVAGNRCLKSCTPFGIMKLIESIKYDLTGKNAVVVGRSNIVGKPVALMLLAAHATVTICHSKTQNLPDVVRRADVVVAAIGRPRFVKGSWIKEGAVVIDVGINRLPDGKLVGDVEFAEASKRASAITPVPGGVGPMTIAMLLWNTLEAAKGA
ncbi:MAG: bifunctional methylenetetrahydrofolate dehydrogenase/methenyltetrahydrofolate cyclohydrolase FolD [Deltaproteobacteria bacterium]|nr:bifunctional methylenetetrahydrofolate dehydrogenase/methenyltetrahydrofolate cyclohydrolase FolD [Deltaproteobacteria bacterium]